MTDITTIITLLLQIALAVVVAFVIPYIKSKKTSEEILTMKEQALQVTSWIQIAVSAAEVIYKGMGGETKNNYVLDFVKNQCEKAKITFDSNVVSAEIEKIGQDLGLWGKNKDEVKTEQEA